MGWRSECKWRPYKLLTLIKPMTKYNVIIPEEIHQVLEFNQKELPGIAVVNVALKDFVQKEVFSYHCSLVINFEDVIANGMPSQNERDVVDRFQDFLDEKIKGNPEKPNALFLARVTWNATRELIWRVFDPELTNEFLSGIIERKYYPREFDYKIDPDKDWELTKWYLR